MEKKEVMKNFHKHPLGINRSFPDTMNHLQITEKWEGDLTQLLSYHHSKMHANFIMYLLPQNMKLKQSMT